MHTAKQKKQAMDKRHREAVDYAIDVLTASALAPYIAEIYLYGSCARGTQKWRSDIDLFVVLKPEAADIEGLPRVIRILKGKMNDPDPGTAEADTVFEIGNAWEKDGHAYYRNVRNDGVLIWKAETT